MLSALPRVPSLKHWFQALPTQPNAEVEGQQGGQSEEHGREEPCNGVLLAARKLARHVVVKLRQCVGALQPWH